MSEPLTIEFSIDDEYRRALIRAAAARMKLEVVAGPRPQEFTVRLATAEQAYALGLETGLAASDADA